MTKRQWVQLIIHNLSGGNSPDDLQGEYHPRIIEKYFELAFNDSILDQEDMYGKIKGWKVEPLIHSYCYTVTCNEKRSISYIELKKSMPALRNGSEIIMIQPVKGEGYPFTKLVTVSSQAYNDMGTAEVTGETLYWREGMNIYFKNINAGYKEVLVKQICSVSEYGDDQSVYL
jgi:hypothetical protein